jgi:hypothetical protein
MCFRQSTDRPGSGTCIPSMQVARCASKLFPKKVQLLIAATSGHGRDAEPIIRYHGRIELGRQCSGVLWASPCSSPPRTIVAVYSLAAKPKANFSQPIVEL